MARTRPKDIGTRAETAIVRSVRQRGFPGADRLTLTGSLDRGDIGLCPGVIIECKGGDAARNASDLKIDLWLDQTDTERINAGATHAFLVTQRPGVSAKNAHRWWSWWRYSWLPHPSADIDPRIGHLPVRLTLDASLALLRAAGYGEPLDELDAMGVAS